MKNQSSSYVNDRRYDYSIYVMQSRAIPAATDGLKSGGRRVLWTGRDGKKYKSATLAGATMPIHPHASPEGAIDTLAAPYGNNIPLFKGDGAFGTLLKPTSYGASRYTSVTVSAFTQDVVFKDIEIIPMMENYDGTLMEPVHFLPLVPLALLNPSEGIAVGYATNILPRALDDLIVAQIAHLKGAKKLSTPMPRFTPTSSASYAVEDTPRGPAYYFKGEVDIKSKTMATITKLPYGQTHAGVIAKIDALVEREVITDVVDKSRNYINIELKFRRGVLDQTDHETLLRMLGLSVRHIENLNVLDFSGKAVWATTPVEMIRSFTDWRLQWYVNRYERLRDLLAVDLQRYYDIRTAIQKKANVTARTTQNRAAFKQYLETIKIVYTDYIADLPVYRFTEEEYAKNEERIKEALATLAKYEELLADEEKRKQVYISELQQILTNYNKGVYN